MFHNKETCIPVLQHLGMREAILVTILARQNKAYKIHNLVITILLRDITSIPMHELLLRVFQTAAVIRFHLCRLFQMQPECQLKTVI